MGMMDMLLLRELRAGHEAALEQTIEKYTAYVCTIIRNAVGAALTHEDIEEVASDVFIALWDNADKVGKLKAYIAAIARNKAKNKIREAAETLPLQESVFSDDGGTPEDRLVTNEKREMVKSAILEMEDTDCEIFLRHYYDLQTVSAISREIGINEAAVKQRLVRGRKKLRRIIGEEAAL
jgi:RNA polymerase sigma-70 factor (ECF subfamily)